MRVEMKGTSAFRYIDVELSPGEELIVEAGAMASMAAGIEMKAKLNGGFFRGLARKFLGSESLFVNHFTNHGSTPQRLVLSSQAPGDMRAHNLNGDSLCLEPGAYVCCTPGVTLGVRWAGFRSFIAQEGLFKLVVSGQGTVWYGGYGAFIEKEINGEYLVDTGHLVAYDPSLTMKIQLAGGIFGSFLGGEGFVTRLEGKGKAVLQTRSLSGLAAWLNPRI